MRIEEEIFKRSKVDFKKLSKFGFIKDNNVYKYSTTIKDDFRIDILVNSDGILTGRIFDTDINDEYKNFRIESQNGKFVQEIRNGFEELLLKIRRECFINQYFISDQANRISSKTVAKYHDEPWFPWEKCIGDGVFKNPNNDKWYGIIMAVDFSKLDSNKSGEIEVLNLKLKTDKIKELLNKKEYYKAYHMNKKNWISIVLNDSLSDNEIMELMKESHRFTETSSEWIIPANPKYYDVINCFNDTDEILWKQSNKISAGTIIYLYVGAPYSEIMYKCEVMEADIPHVYKDNNLSMNHVMKIRLLKRYVDNKFSFHYINKYGVTSIRGPRTIPEELSIELNKE